MPISTLDEVFIKLQTDPRLRLKRNKGQELERQGWETWLKTLGAATFTRPFAPIHVKFWEWNWLALQKLRRDEFLTPKELVGFLPHSRETGKSSNVEWACIAEGALLRGGYVIVYSGTQTQAEEHVTSIRDRIESEHVSDIYPWLGKPKVGAHGNKFGWGREFLMTSGGWAIRPVGADAAIRGGKVLNLRPTLIVIDDLDELGDSPVVVEHKELILTRSILPMGNNKTRVLVPQNPIHANSVVNRMLTNVSMALAQRTVFGEIEDDGSISSRPIPAVKNFAYEVRQSQDGPHSVITRGATNWPGISVENWETTLNRVGPPSFLAEYQHDMTVQQEERVLPEYDDRITMAHVITIDQFEAKYGHRRIPSDWPCDVGLDIGYTTGHKSAWSFLTKAPQGVDLAGSIFRYRGRTFTGVGIDEQSVVVQSELWPDEHLQRQFMSHEKLGERNVLNAKHGWHFHPCDSAKIAGIAQWRHYLKVDHTKPHPFHRDEKDDLGRWKIGCPAWFDIVLDSRQFRAPVDDKGLKRHRDGAFNWRQVPIRLTDKGMTVEQPAKVEDDECFIAGTLITTRRGDIPIEQVSQKDVALTRQGWYDVLACGKTKSEAEIWELKLSNGTRLRGTAQHPIWVAGCGWKPLSELKAGERLLSLTECDFIATQTRRIGHTEHTSSRTFTRFAKVLARYMLNFGNLFTEKSPTAMRFIIGIIIRLIMPIPILNHCHTRNTVAIMDKIGHRNEWPVNAWHTCRIWRKSGIEVQKGESGTENTPRNLSERFRKLYVPATIVKRSILRVLFGISFVLQNANNASKVKLSKWREFAYGALRHFRQPSDLQNEHAALFVRRVSKTNGRGSVYNLSVLDCPEYFANGILAHNCDSTRSLLAGSAFGPLQQPMNAAQRIDAVIPSGYHRAELMARVDLSPNQAHLTSEMAEYLAKKAVKKKVKALDYWGNELKS